MTTEQESEKDAENKKVLLAGLSFTHPQISSLLTCAKTEILLRPVRFPILGEYKDCFSGEKFVGWLLENVPKFQKDLEIILVAARDPTERGDLLRRLGVFGNHFDCAAGVSYQFRLKVPRVINPPVYIDVSIDIAFLRLSPLASLPQPRPDRCPPLLPHRCNVLLPKSQKPLYVRGYRQLRRGVRTRNRHSFGAEGKQRLPKPITVKLSGLSIATD